MNLENKTLAFKVSSGLKNLIGRDLISDKYIAIFELVKNSYDANASNVKISYLVSEHGKGKIIISDNGSGMTYEDIIQKWLFVAYSEKKPQNRSKSAYREEIKREVAGAKGVGRFSCDRLGASLQLVTKTKDDTLAHVVNVNWNKFEVDDTKEFVEIPVDYTQVSRLPSGYDSGTTLIVNDLREVWNRDELLRLKRSLMKLISPDADKGELPFEIEMDVPTEKENDEKLLEEYHKDDGKGNESKKKINPDRDIVNGQIKNDIFEKLNIKTTNIEVVISEDGRSITSTLSDRGQYIFSVKERNRKYALLKNIHISIFYLNQSAKINFTRQMGGVTPKNYGSVFIYKNGFRINPYGEPGQDIFGIDQRKAQGWKRFLGTREIMGRISIKGDNDEILNIVWNKFTEEEKDILEEAVQRTIKRNEDRDQKTKKKVLEMNPTFPAAVNNIHFFSHSDRLYLLEKAIKILLDNYSLSEEEEFSSFKSHYEKEISNYRNALGHRKSTDNIIEITKDNFVPIDEALHQKMRKNLSRYNLLIEQLELFVTEEI